MSRYDRYVAPATHIVPTQADLDNYNPHATTPLAESVPAHLKVLRMSDVAPEQVQWLWPNRFPLGKYCMLGGDPGKGKSHFAMDFAARTTTATPFPDGSGHCPKGSVVILSAEDDPADTIRPRLDRAGADVSKVHVIEGTRFPATKDGKMQDRTFNLEEDLPLLEQVLRDLGDVTLVIIDPISSYLGNVDSHKNAEVRGLIAPLSDLAARYNCCVLGITHLNKGGGNKSTYRMTGSLAFAAAARAVWLWAEDVDQPGRLLLLPVKNNLAKRQDALACKIMSDERGSFLAWEADPVALTADGFLEREASKATGGEDDDSRMREAVAYLNEALADGPMLTTELEDGAKANGIVKRTLDRARKQLNCKASKRLSDKKWVVSLNTANNNAIKPFDGGVGDVGGDGGVDDEFF